MSISDNATDIATQETLADSLVAPLDAEGQPVLQGDEGEYGEQESGGEEDGPGELHERDEINSRLWDEAERIQQGSQQQEIEQETEQPSEITPQAVQAGSQQLEQQVNDLGLADPAEASLLGELVGRGSCELRRFGKCDSEGNVERVGRVQGIAKETSARFLGFHLRPRVLSVVNF